MNRRRLLHLGVAAELGLLVVPLGRLLTARAALSAGLFVGAAAIGYGGAASVDAPFTTFSTRPGVWLLAVPPLASLPAVAYGAATGRQSVVWSGLVGLLALLPALFVAVLGADERWRRTLAAATVHERFEARTGPDQRRLVTGAAALFVAAGLGMFGAGFARGDLVFGGVSYAPLLAAGGAMFWLTRRPRTVRVTSAGLAVNRVVHPWSRFESVAVEDDVIALAASRPGTSFTFDREDVSDEAAVVEAVERELRAAGG
ncbi:MAG: hypothetical protein ABEJ08_04030 [Halobacteriaceae archaeon]